MAKFTVELRYLVETNYDLGLNDYPIFNEDYRETLNNKIISHFYMREIGFETAGLFVNRLRTKMNEIMPYYNKLYETELLKVDPFQSYSYNQTKYYNEDKNTNTNLNQNNKVVESDTPQGLLSINDIEDEVYASKANIGNSDSAENYTGKIGSKETTEATGAINGTPFSDLLMRYRMSLINIDMMIIEDLEELFMQIWDY